MTRLLPIISGALAATLWFPGASRAQTTPLPEGPGKDTLVASCGACHDVDTVVAKRRTSDDWRLMIEGMISRGAVATDDEVVILHKYLTRHVGLVNVNSASSDELQLALEITSQEADAIVKHRSDRGEFADLEALKSVPGLDSKRVNEWKDHVVFR